MRPQEHCDGSLPAVPGSWVRLIIEKPFGKDLASSEVLSEELGKLYNEQQLWRIDHYLVRGGQGRAARQGGAGAGMRSRSPWAGQDTQRQDEPH